MDNCVLPLEGFRERLLQVGGGSGERKLDSDAPAVVEDGGEVVPFGGGQDGKLIVGLACMRKNTSQMLHMAI